jgi:Domain of unknown function (DUF6438)
MIRALSAGLLIGLSGCAPRQSGTASTETSAAPASPVITLERTPCFGRCPVYTISVTAAGDVTYEGKSHVKQLGTANAKIPSQRVDSLLSELDRGGYFGFADRYAASEPACGRYATDSPSVLSSVTLNGKSKRIQHDYGCGSAPGALMVLERRIDEVLGSGQWTGR